MTSRADEVFHDTIRLVREIAAPPAAVFGAYADVDARQQWTVPSADEVLVYSQADFSVGGIDTFVCGLRIDPAFSGEVRYERIEPDAEVVYVERIHARAALVSLSLVTWQITPTADGALVSVTDQITSFASDAMIHGSRIGLSAALAHLEQLLATGT